MTGRLYALLIGIDAYPSPVPRLEGCVNDVTAIHSGLSGRVGSSLEAMVLTDGRASRSGVIESFQNHLGRAGPDDVALCYFSGHGSQQRSAAAAMAVEPDRLDETIVLADSRLPGRWDLADKELAALVAGVAARAGHVLVVLDCCHSGDGVRDLETGARIRLAPEDGRRRPPDSYLSASATDPGELAFPLRDADLDQSRSTWSEGAGDHVLIAACRSSETAKELLVDGRPRGALSAALDATLRAPGSLPSYREVLRLVTARVLQLFDDQHPQLEALRAIDLDQPFLGRAGPALPRRLTVSHLPDGWSLDAGAIHGVAPAIGDDSTELAVYPLTAPTSGAPLAIATVTEVLPDRSLVSLSRPLDANVVYRGVVTGIPLRPLAVAVTGDALGTAALRAAAASADDTLIELVPEGHDPALLVQAGLGGFVITRPGVTRPLVPVVQGPDRAARTVAALEHVARWMRLSTLQNPASTLPVRAVNIRARSEAGGLTPDGQLRIAYAAGQAPAFEVTLTNTTSWTVWCSLLDLTETYGVFTDAFPAGSVQLEPGQATSVALSGYLPDELWQLGTTQVVDQLRVVVSTVEFDPRSLEQGELDVSAASPGLVRSDLTPTSSLDHVLGRVTRKLPPAAPGTPAADWRIEDLYVVTSRAQL